MQDVAVNVADLGGQIGQKVLLRGWLCDKDNLGQLVFLRLRDGTGFAQAVVDSHMVDEQTWQIVSELTRESSLEIVGKACSDERADGGCEVHVQRVTILHLAAPDFPDFKGMDREELLRRRHLWLRSRRQQAILRVRAAVALSLREFLAAAGVVNVDPPLLIAGPSPAERRHFNLDYFGDRAFLASEWTAHLAAAAAALGRVYGFGPVMRADPNPGENDLTESWQLEVVAAFMDLETATELTERLLAEALSQVLTSTANLFRADLQRDPAVLISACRYPFNRDPGPQMGIRAMVNASSFYLVAPENYGRIVTGYHRAEATWPAPHLPGGRRSWQDWREDLGRFGAFPLVSVRLDFERLLAWLVGASHPSETIAFPRTQRHLAP